jgi:hypothetical protein
VADGRSSPELGLAAAPRHGDLPRRHRRQKGDAGTLAVGSPWVERRRGGLAAVESTAWRRRSVCEVLVERIVWGVWCGGVVVGATLYSLGEEARQPARRGMVCGGAV